MAPVGLRELAALSKVIAGGKLSRYAAGRKSAVQKFENRLQERLGVRHVLTVNSGTSALMSALAAAGIGPGDEVLVPAYSWVATATAVLAVGAVPILVEIDESLTIDPVDAVRKITPYTRAIMPVHMRNLVCNMDEILSIAQRHRLLVIEDACQAVGVRYKGRAVGTIGDAGAFSFNYHKNINAGEGGAVLSNDDRIFTRARMFHDVGSFIREHEFEGNEPQFYGLNFRASELTGAVLLAQLSRLDDLLERLRSRHRVMHEQLSKCKGVRISPHHDPDNAVGLSVICGSADEARQFATQRGVERLIDTGRHVYTNWEPLFSRRSFHPLMDPFKWANRDISYSEDMCPKTISILERTCYIRLGPEYPLPVVWMQARRLSRLFS